MRHLTTHVAKTYIRLSSSAWAQTGAFLCCMVMKRAPAANMLYCKPLRNCPESSVSQRYILYCMTSESARGASAQRGPRQGLCVRAMFGGLAQNLGKAWDLIRKDGKLTADNIKGPMREIRRALLEADVGPPLLSPMHGLVIYDVLRKQAVAYRQMLLLLRRPYHRQRERQCACVLAGVGSVGWAGGACACVHSFVRACWMLKVRSLMHILGRGR